MDHFWRRRSSNHQTRTAMKPGKVAADKLHGATSAAKTKGLDPVVDKKAIKGGRKLESSRLNPLKDVGFYHRMIEVFASFLNAVSALFYRPKTRSEASKSVSFEGSQPPQHIFSKEELEETIIGDNLHKKELVDHGDPAPVEGSRLAQPNQTPSPSQLNSEQAK